MTVGKAVAAYEIVGEAIAHAPQPDLKVRAARVHIRDVIVGHTDSQRQGSEGREQEEKRTRVRSCTQVVGGLEILEPIRIVAGGGDVRADVEDVVAQTSRANIDTSGL